MKKMIANTFNSSARVLVVVAGHLTGLTRLIFNKLTHKKEAASATPGSKRSIGITIRNVNTSLNDVGERRLEIIQSAMMPSKMRKVLVKKGFLKVQLLVSASSFCCSKIVAPH